MEEEVSMEKIQPLIDKIKVDIQDGRSEEEIFQFLHSLLGKDTEFDGQVAEHLASIPHVKVANVLQRMLHVSNEKKVQKNIRRSLYRLRSKGVVIEKVQLKKEASILRPLQAEQPKGFVNGYDFSWNRFLLLVIPHAGRGLTVLHGLVCDEKGLLNFSGGEISRKEFRGFFEEVQKASPTPLVEMEPSYVGFLFAQAYQLTLEKKGDLPQDYLRLKSEIERIRKEYERP